MLAIRLQRVGRKAYPTYKIIVQDAHRHPSSGRVVAYVGSFNPHTKEVTLDKDSIERYMDNGAQPTSRVIRLLQDAKVKLPKWVDLPKTDAKKATRNPEKLRKNRPEEEAVEVAEAPAEEVAENAEAEVAPEAVAQEQEQAEPEAPAEVEEKEAE
ncbi:30S ribosomal protein S16 [Candidatus Saccharibacteria bacterium]|nr:30S ribosomal protein S16 [Candidatus Saccharibacteria bacterium]